MKKISVIVTCHNLEKYLDECIDSIKQQVHRPDEIILIHDGCTETAKAYTGVTTVFCDHNQGVTRAREMGFRISTGTHIMFFDADDVMPLNYLLEINKIDADVVYPNCVVWAGWGNSNLDNVFHEAPHKVNLKRLLEKNEILMPSLFKREWFDKVGGFDHSLPIFEDWEFWVKIMANGGNFVKSCAFMYYRQRQNSRNHQNDDLKRKIYKEIKEKFTLPDPKPAKV